MVITTAELLFSERQWYRLTLLGKSYECRLKPNLHPIDETARLTTRSIGGVMLR
jgi:hypothetical protein